jgi:nucleotide-binding universal stress UspA family protein
MKDKFELKKILVSLDLSEMDEQLIRITAYAARMMHSDRVYFIHIAQDLDMPKDLRKKWGGVLAPVDENIEHSIRQHVAEFFKGPKDCESIIEVHEGNATDRLLKLAKQKDVDMLVLGIKDKLKGSGALPDKVVRASPRSVLLVPEVLPRIMDKILVPIDFSDYSLLALRQALIIQQNSTIPVEIKCQHVYQLPTGWHKTGKSEREFADIMCEHARKDYKAFLRKLRGNHEDIPCVFTYDADHNPAKEIYSRAVNEQSDLIIIGSKGKTHAAAALMGSVAERMVHYNKGIPLLIVKDKTENIGFLEALLRI